MQHDTVSMLRAFGLKRTSVRVAVLNVLLNAEGPVSHREVMDGFADAVPDRVSVYRTLHRFVAAGIAHRVDAGTRGWLFEAAHNCRKDQCHLHFTCTSCKAVICLDVFVAPAVLPEGYRPRRQSVMIDGTCPACGGQESHGL